jgi:hypothetical protein
MKIVNLIKGPMEYPLERKIPMQTKDLSFLKKAKTFLGFTREITIEEDYYLHLPFEFMAGGRPVSYIYIKAPKGSVVNGASVPKILRMFLSPNGVLYIGALFHDICYKEGKITLAVYFTELKKFNETSYKLSRKEADELFFYINDHVTGMRKIAYSAYVVLRGFGWIGWNKYRKEEKS